MQINRFSVCSEPKKLTNFKSLKENSGKRVRYKHYYEMPEEDLRAFSMLKAYNSVQKSGKMRLKEAMPALTSLAIGTSLALAQPGKFSTKAKTGLGFLALKTAAVATFDLVSKGIDKYYQNKKEKNPDEKNSFLLKVGALIASTAAVVGIASVVSKKGILPKSSKIAKFLEKEKTTLVNELNATKIGKFTDKVINPFFEKHQKVAGFVGNVLPFGLIAGAIVANDKINKSISKDLINLSKENYIKGKSAQIDARAHFDSVNAIEV